MQYEIKDLRIKATKDFWKSVSRDMQRREIRKRNQWFLAVAVDAIKPAQASQAKSEHSA